MSSYTRLSFSEREEISLLLAQHIRKSEIARRLNRSASTISREIRRSARKAEDYRALKAEKMAQGKKYRQKRKIDINARLRDFIVEHIVEKRWTPEQVAQRLKILYPDDMDMRISHESIYNYLYVRPKTTLKKLIAANLRRHHKNRRNKKERQKSTPIQDFLSIEERPKEVADRIVPGHWEGDLIMGAMNQSAIGTLVERTTRFTLLVRLTAKDANSVRLAFAEEFKFLPPELKKTLTYDQGQEMAQHKLFSAETNITVYFAHPHSPWERGTNENTNGIVRQFFPRGTDFQKVDLKELKRVQELINERPRKIHDFYTPTEVFYKLFALEN